MSLMGYFSKRDDFKLGMPASGRQPDKVGITYSGPVLNGEISVESMHREIEQRVATISALGTTPDGIRLRSNADNHCWLLRRRLPRDEIAALRTKST